MSSAAQIRATPVSVTVDHYLQVCLFLMLLSGFGALATTGQLDLPSVVLVLGALNLRGYWLLRGLKMTLHERTVRWLALAYGGFFFLDLFVVSGHFLNATVHLVLFGMVLRLFSAQRTRDHVFLALLAFAMVLASAVLTVSGTFLVSFAAFLLTAVVTFILMEMSRAQAVASVSGAPDAGLVRQRLPWTLAGIGASLLTIILAGAAVIFFFLPRISSGYLSSLQIGNDISTGFSSSVELGRIGEIQRSNAIVMHVKVEGDTTGNRELRMRGVTLGTFDGRVWSNRLAQIVLPQSQEGNFVLARSSVISPGATIRYHVFAEPLGTNVFFLAERPLTLAGPYRLVAADSSAAAFDLDRERLVSAYDGTSLAEDASGAVQHRTLPATLAPQLASLYLELPSLDPRIPQLARDITAGVTDDGQRAAALEAYLSGNYPYTLELPAKEPKDPLANFLFERKRGHCEYFASSMAVMLRILGIPSRVVNGFRGGEFNDVSGEYIVRAREAHSWVEAYIAGRGWVRYDPTPAAMTAPRIGWSRLLFYTDALSSFWREWIVNYDATHQRALGEGTLRNTRTLAQIWRERIRAPYLRLLEAARRTRDLAVRSPQRWISGALASVLLLLAVINLRRLRNWVEHRRLAAHPEEAPQAGASLWYVRLLHHLSRSGWKKPATQTPEEFASSIQDARLRAPVTRFTEHYEKARFGASAHDAEQLPRLFEEIANSKR